MSRTLRYPLRAGSAAPPTERGPSPLNLSPGGLSLPSATNAKYAMEYDEHEQSERVRGWLAQNGSSLITGIALGLALVFGWQWWQGRGERHKEEAAGQYATFDKAIEAKDAAKAKVLAAQVQEKFADTGYGTLA